MTNETTRGAPGRVRPLLLLEMNEIPWRVVDRASSSGRYPHLASFFRSATTYTTVAGDKGELSPWVTWPSLHRGLDNTEHNVLHLGQDVRTFRGTPLWQEYRARGLNVGVCGSMQSWPPVDPGAGGFYIPDTFAHDERCLPRYLEPLQRFNLSLVRKNGLVVRDSGIVSREFAALLPSLARAKVRPKTYARVVAQLARERIDRSFVARRPIFQTLLFWDVFKGLYDPKSPPALATFFTNHVAGVMHRYWDQIFPEDFPEQGARPRPHAVTMAFALAVVDEMLADVEGFVRACPELIVVFATSMGQGAVKRLLHEGVSASVPELSKLLSTFGLGEGRYAPLLAMVPQVAAEVPDEGDRRQLTERLGRAVTASGEPLFITEVVGQGVSITIRTPRLVDIRAGGFDLSDAAGGRRRVAWADAGIEMNDVSAGTAYHIPEGVLAVRGRGFAADDARTALASRDVKALLLAWAGLASRAATSGAAA